MAVDVVHRTHPEASAPLIVQNRAEDARGVEGRQAQPVYRPVRADERCRVQIAYDPVVLYWEIPHALLHERRQYRLAYILPLRITNSKGHHRARARPAFSEAPDAHLLESALYCLHEAHMLHIGLRPQWGARRDLQGDRK